LAKKVIWGVGGWLKTSEYRHIGIVRAVPAPEHAKIGEGGAKVFFIDFSTAKTCRA